MFPFAVGYPHGDSLRCHLAGYACLGGHAPSAQAGLFPTDVGRKVLVRLHLAYQPCFGVRRQSGVDAVDVAQDDERVDIHHRGDESGEFVVVRKHQFGDRNRVVLVHDGQHAAAEHHVHAGTLVQVVAARGKALFRGEHLAHGNAMFAEELTVQVSSYW